MGNSRTGRLVFLGAALALAVLAACPAAAAKPPPLPESSATYGAVKAQRIRFDNAPLWQKAKDAVARGDDAGAIRAYGQILANDPGSNPAKLALIALYERQGRLDDAIALCADLLDRYPDRAEIWNSRGVLEMKAGRHAQAAESFEKALRLTPSESPGRRPLLLALGQACRGAGRAADAERAFARALEIEFAPDAALELAQLHETQGRHDDALALLVQLTAKFPDRPDTWELKGVLEMKAGRHAQAAESFEKALRLTPSESPGRRPLLLALGQACRGAGRAADAERAFARALEIEFAPDAALELIDLYEKQDRHDDALALSGRLAAKHPERADVWQSKGILEIRKAHYPQAAESLEAAFRLTPPDSPQRRRPILLLLGQAYRRLGRDADAGDAYARALDIEFTPDAALEYFYCLKTQNTPEKGRAFLERALAGPLPPSLRREAQYELARLNRQAGKMQDFFRGMDELVQAESEARRLHDYALDLSGAGDPERTVRTLEKAFSLETDPGGKYRTAMFAANIELQRGRTAEAKDWINRATPFADSEAFQALALASADFSQADYRGCAGRLLGLTNRPASASLLLGIACMKLRLEGPALEFLDEIRAPETLPADERLTLFGNRAYLNFGQNRYAEARRDAEQALALAPSADLALLRLKALAASAPTNDIEKEAEPLLHPAGGSPAPTGAQQVQALLVVGRHLFNRAQYRPAVDRLSEAVERDPSLAEAYYVRGLAWHALGQPAEAISNLHAYLRLDPRPPATFWGDLGQAEGARGDYEAGTAALGRSLGFHSVDVDTLSDRGYQYLKWALPHQGTNRTVLDRWSHNGEAQASFGRAIDLYADLAPRVPTNEAAAYREREVAMKREYTKLDRVFGIQAYLSRTDYGFPTNVGISSVDGALPSQGGIELCLRPPCLGFLNERTLDLFGTLNGSFQRQSWTPDPDSYQGMVGLRLKPFIAFNYNMSFARLFKIGANSENNWLWRNMGSWERGDKPAPGRLAAFNLKLFGDLGYYFEPRTRWYGYLDGRAGPCWRLHQAVLLTLPQVMGIVRQETHDEGGSGSYGLVGLGGALRLYEPERRFTINRIYLDLFAYYTWGRFSSTPAGFDGRSFDGPMIGVNLVK